VRRFREDPVAADIIERILEAATRAPSARNAQPWRFVVVREAQRRRALRDAFRTAYESVRPAGPAGDDEMHRSVAELAEHLDIAPVIIAVCLDPDEARSSDVAARYGSIFPAVQNLCLAARAAGLGTVLTTVARREEAALREAMAIPGDVEVVALIPVGWPDGGFPSTSRRAVKDVAFADEWGRPLSPA
jgi:nitroreductase